MNTYKSTLNNLTQIINNGRKRKGRSIGNEFKAVVRELHEQHGKDISTKFLRGLVSLEKSNRQKSQRITYLILKSGLKTQRENRYIFGWTSQNWRTDITEYAHKENGLIYCEFPRYLFNEEMEISDIRNKENDFKSNQDKLSLRNGINKGGGVYIKNVTPQNIGKFFKANSKEVLYFITGF